MSNSVLNEAVAMLLMAYAAEKQRQEQLAVQRYQEQLQEQQRQEAEAERKQREFDNRWDNKLLRRVDIAKNIAGDYFDPATAQAVRIELDKIALTAPQVADGDIHAVSRREIDKQLKTIQGDLSVLSAVNMGLVPEDNKTVQEALKRADEMRSRYFPTAEEITEKMADNPAGNPADNQPVKQLTFNADPAQDGFARGMAAGRQIREAEEQRRQRRTRSRTAALQQSQLLP